MPFCYSYPDKEYLLSVYEQTIFRPSLECSDDAFLSGCFLLWLSEVAARPEIKLDMLASLLAENRSLLQTGDTLVVNRLNLAWKDILTSPHEQRNPGLSDPQLRQLIAAHIDDDSFCRYVIQQDINKIALNLREAHKDDFFSVPEDNPLEDFLQTAEETASPDSDPEQAALAFICKRLKLNLKKLSEEEKKWLKKIAQKSDLLKNPNPQRGRK